MRLLFIHPFLSARGGAQLALQWLLKGLAARGHSVKLLIARESDGVSEDLRGNGVDVKAVPEKPEPFSVILEKELAGVDAVIAGNYPATLWAGIAKLKLKNFPPLLWYCNEPPRNLYEETMSPHFLRTGVDPKFYFPWTLALRRKQNISLVKTDQGAVSKIDRILAISGQTARWLKAIYGRSARVLPLAVGDVNPAEPEFPRGDFVFLSPAGIEPIKNFQTILNAFKIFLDISKAENVKLILTGDGLWKKKAGELARKNKIFEKTEFPGSFPRQAFLDLYTTCHAVVYIPLDEPYGLVSLEAGLNGKPVIASNHGGPSEIVIDRVTGLLVDPQNPADVADAMKALFQDRDTCEKLGREGLTRMKREFDFGKFLSDFENAVQSNP